MARLCFFLCALWLAQTLVFAQECSDSKATPIVASGFAAIVSDEISARDEAVKDALRVAVEQVGGVVIESSAVVSNFQLINEEVQTKTAGFVSSYEVLEGSADAEGRIYNINIQACVNPDIPNELVQEIKEDLESLGYLLKEQLGNPRLVVQARSPESPAVAVSTQNILSDYFRELGFTLRNQPSSDCLALSSELDNSVADLLICAVVQATVQESSVREGLYTAKATLRLDASLVSNKQLIASTTNESSQTPSSVADKAAQAALEEALSPGILESFTTEIIRNLNASVETQTSIQITISGLPDLQSFRQVQAFVQSIRGVEKLQDRGMNNGQAMFEVEGSVSALDIVNRLESIEDLPLRITGYSPFSIEAELRDE